MRLSWAIGFFLLTVTTAACRTTTGQGDDAAIKSLIHPLFSISPLRCGSVTSQLSACLGLRGSDNKSFILMERHNDDPPHPQMELPVTRASTSEGWTWYEADQVPGEWLGELGKRQVNLGFRNDGQKGKFLIWDATQRAWRSPAIAAGAPFAIEPETATDVFTLQGTAARSLRDLLKMLGGSTGTSFVQGERLICTRPVVPQPITECLFYQGSQEKSTESLCIPSADSDACQQVRTLAGLAYEGIRSEAGPSNTGTNGQILVGSGSIKAATLRCQWQSDDCTFIHVP